MSKFIPPKCKRCKSNSVYVTSDYVICKRCGHKERKIKRGR